METMSLPPGGLSGNVLMYQRPEPLNHEVHAKLGVKPSEKPFGFAAGVSAVPLHVAEMTFAAVNYPVIFAGDAKQPLAVLGLREGENLFVDADGQWEPGVYIPAFVRRYPFVLANDDAQQRLVVCIDRGADFVVENAPQPLFKDNQPTDYTQNALKFCEEFETERLRSDSFVALMNSMDLFEVRATSYTPPQPDGTPGAPMGLSEYWSVTAEKINALPADKLVELRDNGGLALIYAHQLSLNTWDQLVARALKRGPILGQPVAANA